MEYNVFGITLTIYVLIFVLDGKYGIGHTVKNVNNVCPRTVSYEEQIPVNYTEQEKVVYKSWCFSFPPRCTRHRWRTVHKIKFITSIKSKTINECCKGYLKVNEACIPVCYEGCFHGKCVEPNRCVCDKGWEGADCKNPCKSHLYGPGCQKTCNCMHNATCDKKDGTCYCTPGYTGRYCQFPCSYNTYGLNCIKKCQCKNDAMCNVEDGSCSCQPGYFGEFCEIPCESGFHGEKCLKSCLCFNETTASCNNIDGTCVCKPGYIGKYCEIECSNFTYGAQCANVCDCENSDMCDPVTGECSCLPGWTGKKCLDICPSGKFGDSCQSDCLPCYNGTGLCDHITGYCECQPGYTGENCELRCPEGFWGLNCTQECVCLHGENCDAETGECICLPGWTGPACLNVCPEGCYGFKCLHECECPENSTCDPENGHCTCIYGYTGGDCHAIVEYQIGGHYQKSQAHSHSNTIIALCIVFTITLLTLVIAYAYFRYKFRDNEDPAKEGVSTDTIVRVGFTNPNYETSEVMIEKSSIEFYHSLPSDAMEQNKDSLRRSLIPDMQSNDSVIDIKLENRTFDQGVGFANPFFGISVTMVESSESSTDIYHTLPSNVMEQNNDTYQSSLTPDKSIRDIKLENRNFAQDSSTGKLKKISNIEAALENRLSGSTTERKSVTFSNPASSIYSSSDDPDDDYEPEVLKDFNIIDENIYEILPEKLIKMNFAEKTKY